MLAGPVVPIAGDAAIIAERVVERPAIEAEVGGIGDPHRVEQLEPSDVGVAFGGHQRDLRVEQLLLRIEDVENRTGADALLGAGAFKGELVRRNRDLVGLNRIARGLVGRISRARGGDDGTLGADDLLQRLGFGRLGLPDARGGKSALVEGNSPAKADGRLGARIGRIFDLSEPTLDLRPRDADRDTDSGRQPG